MRTITRPPSLGVYAPRDRARRDEERRPVPLPQAGAVHGEALASILGITPTTTYVSERTAGGLPALDFGVTLIASAVSQMLTSAEVYDDDGSQLAPPAIVARPHPLFTPTEFWDTVIRSVLMHGNFVAPYADYDEDGWPRQMVPVDSSAVSVESSSGIPFYKIEGTTFRYDEVFHVRRHAPIGTFWGMGVVEKFRKALTGQLAEQNYGQTAYTNGGVPSALIILDTEEVTQTALTNVSTQWQARTSGLGRVPVVLPRTIDVKPLSWSPEDAEFIAARQLSAADCAYMLGLEPSDLEATVGGSASLTYANLSQRSLARIVQSYAPVMALIEEALTDALPGPQRVRGNPEALLRSTTKERFEVYQLGKELEIYTTPELRELEGRPPVDTDQEVEQ